MLQLEQVGVQFGYRWIFRRLSCDIEPGHCLLVVGPNGSGKSTLMRVFAGLQRPTEGWVHRSDSAQRQIGYAALDQALYPALTGRENWKLASQWRGIPEPPLPKGIDLGEAWDRPVSEYSTGMRTRLKLAVAVQHAPPILLLDEPTASLDESGRTLVDDIVHRQLQTGAVIIATNVSHERRHATHEIHLGE